jgi:hypothetical protein
VYDYQCSSSFVTYYAPAFVYLALNASFVVPLYQAMLVYCYDRSAEGSVWRRLLHKALPRMLKPIQPTAEVLPRHVDNLDTAQSDMGNPYFDANNHFITLVTYLGILLTFGVVFPPLALAMSVTMISVAWQSRIVVGHFLYQTRRLGELGYVNIIESECRGAVTLPKIRRSVMLIICFSCAFFALFLFDSLGSEESSAYWVLICMPLVSLCMYAIIRLRRYYKGALTLDFHLNSAAWDANDNLSKWTAAVSESGDGDGGRAGIELADCNNSINVCYSDEENMTYKILQT